MKQNRPINLDLATLKFPAMAIASILHRISGVLIFVLLPFMLFLLQRSLAMPDGFDTLQNMLRCAYVKLFVWAFFGALAYHLIAGVRHLIMDLGFGEGLPAGRYSAMAVIVLGVVAVFGLGAWIW